MANEVSWVAPIIVGALIPFLVMIVSKVGQSSKTAATNIVRIDEMKSDVNEMRVKIEAAIDRGDKRITEILKTVDEMRSDIKLHGYKLDRLEKNGNGAIKQS